MDPTQDKWTSKFSKKADAYLTSEVELGRERQIKEIGKRFLQPRLNVLKIKIADTEIASQTVNFIIYSTECAKLCRRSSNEKRNKK